MEMTPVWKERKSKSPFPLFPHCLGKLANTASLPHSHSFGDDLGFLFSTSSFNFNFDESVTDMPGTFCYRHARSLRKERELGFSPCNGTSCTKCIAPLWLRTLSKQDWYTYLAEKKAQGLKPRSLLAFLRPD
jgi:hypothetical protein